MRAAALAFALALAGTTAPRPEFEAASIRLNVAGEPLTKTQTEMDLMLQSLLEKRFALQLHRETRQLPIYEMTLANTSKLKQASCTVFDADNHGPSDAHYCGASGLGRKGRDWTLDGNAMKMSQLADTLSWMLGAGRTVVDKTGYKETFDAHLRWTPDQGQVGATDASPSPDDVGSIFSVLEQQLGLKLKPATGPIEVLVIDRVERPSAN